MRGIECTTPNCAHLHARTDEQLVDQLVGHSREVHSDTGLTSIAARRLVEAEGYEDSVHDGTKRAESVGRAGRRLLSGDDVL